MDNKGFTLVELLAVIALIAVLLLIFTPNISNMINKFRNEDKVEILKNSAISAAKEYVADGNINSKINLSLCPNIEIVINVSELIDNNYLNNDDDGFYTDKTITVTYDCNNKKFTEYKFN